MGLLVEGSVMGFVNSPSGADCDTASSTGEIMGESLTSFGFCGAGLRGHVWFSLLSVRLHCILFRGALSRGLAAILRYLFAQD